MPHQFERIGLWGRFHDPKVAEPAAQISSHLSGRGHRVIAPADRSAGLTTIERVAADEFATAIDLVIAIGGDGNLLRAARCVAGHDVPLIGVNRGRLGFLTDITPEQMITALDRILAGDFLAEQRLLLGASIRGVSAPPMFALNDVVLQKGDSGRILDFETSVDGSYVNTHGGDGLIVATPTGSTAYALSCNGPIIRPDVDALVMVPICPHTLSDRPLVVPRSSVITVEVAADQDGSALITCDGEELGALEPAQVLEIRTAKESVTLLHPTDYNYYDLLRSKLNWGRANRTG
jgi:NAD+ kinase